MGEELRLGWLHIFGQWSWHGEAAIAGDRVGVEMLRDALNAALADADGVAMAADVFTNDGEGYRVNVHVLPEGEMKRLAVPYIDEIAADSRDALWPSRLPVQPKHPRRIVPEEPQP